MPVANECGDTLCPLSPHAATGWCLASSGAPVLVITTLDCPPGDGSLGATVVLIDPVTGLVVPPEPVVPCGDKDWEVNQLCDYDPVTGDLIATFVQVFRWDETLGSLVITLVRADNPTIPYVPTGTVRACTDDETAFDVEVTEFCYDDAGTTRHGWQAWVFRNGVHTGTNLYYDASGATLVAPTIVECPQVSTEGTLADVLATLLNIDANTDDLEACCAAGNALLTLIHADVDGVEAALTTLIGHVDGLEGCCAASNVLLTAIAGHVDGVEGLLTSLASAVYAEDSPHASGASGTFVLGVRNDAAAARTSADGDYSPISTDAAGRVGITDLGGSITVDGTVSAAEAKAEDSPHGSGDSGIPVWGVRNDGSVGFTNNDGDYSPIAVDSAGRMKVAVEVGGGGGSPVISGGYSIYKNLDVNNVGQLIKGSPGQIYAMILSSTSGVKFVKFYNKAVAPIVGTDVPVFTVPLEKGTASVFIDFSFGVAFSLGIGIGATTLIADSNTGNPAVNDVVATVFYK